MDTRTDSPNPPTHNYIRIFHPLLFPIFFFNITCSVLPISGRNLFNVFHVNHSRWLPDGKLSFGSFHNRESRPFISSFLRLLLQATSCLPFRDWLIVGFRKCFLDSSRLPMRLPPYKGCLTSDSCFVFSILTAIFHLILGGAIPHSTCTFLRT